MYRIGIDLGGTNIAAAIVGGDGGILVKKSVPANIDKGKGGIIEDIIELCYDLLDLALMSLSQITSVGIGVPGIVNPMTGILVASSNLKLEDIPIGHLMHQVLKIPVFVENDANCAALGEAVFGSARGSKNSVTITLGTGVGGGIIVDDKIYSGTFFGAGEMHQVIRAGGELCSCGRRGCWEAYVSARGLVREFETIKHKDKPEAIQITPKAIFDAAWDGDKIASRAVEIYVNNLCIGLGNIVNMLQPEIIVIGGGISGQGRRLIDAIESRMTNEVLGGSVNTKFVIAALGNDAGIIGAAILPK